MAAPDARIVFANQLRGLAVLCVLLVHYTTVVHLLRPDLAWVVAAPPLDTPVPAIAHWVNTHWFDAGKFGITVFFLISGFVIPFSLQGTTAVRFLVARALRIYPAFWLALLIEGMTIQASSSYWHIPAPYGLRDYLINGLLVETLLDRQTVDWVSWTLSLEVKFYILAAMLRPAILACRVWPLLAIAAVSVGVNALQGAGLVHLPDQLVGEATYLVLILIGTLFNYQYRGALAPVRLALAVLVLAAAFVVSFDAGPTHGSFATPRTLSFGMAVLAFAACYAARRRFRTNQLFDGVAAISYPLYLVHAGVGFTAISFLIMALHLPYATAASLALAMSTGIAIMLHRLVERPCIRLGRAIMRAAASGVMRGVRANP